MLYTHDIFYKHDTGIGHPETADRLDAALAGITRSGFERELIRNMESHADTDRIIAKVHSADYQRELEDAARVGMRLFHSLDNPISRETFAAARTAVGITLTAAADAFRENRPAFVVARPPGHHAERVEAMGFCFFNTIACAAEWLREQPGIERVFIYDFDVHHGNGTQHLFEARDDVFYASSHRYPFYPGTGGPKEIGSGTGRGFTRNWPMNAGEGDRTLLHIVEKELIPLIDDYKPQAILLSAGFDAHRNDPLGGMRVSEEAYGEITRRLVEVANRHCPGRIVSLLEGGYDMEGLASSVDEHVRALLSAAP